MKLKFQFSLVALAILILVAGAIAAGGVFVLTDITLDLDRQILTDRILALRNQLRDAYQTLEISGVSGVAEYRDATQKEILERWKSFRFGKTGRLFVVQENRILLSSSPSVGTIFRFQISQSLPTDRVEEAKSHALGKGSEGQKIVSDPGDDLRLFIADHEGKDRLFVHLLFSPWKWDLFLSLDLDEVFAARNAFLRNTAVILGIGLLLGGGILFWFAHGITRPLAKAVAMANAIAEGSLPPPAPATSQDEIGTLLSAFNRMIETTRAVVEQARTLSEGNYATSIRPRSKDDTLSHALVRMTEALRTFHESQERTNWQKSGMAELAVCLRGDLTIEALGQNVLNFLAEKVGFCVATLYVQEEETQSFHLVASYAYRQAPSVVRWGEGLTGQAAFHRSIRILEEVPEDYLPIASTLGKTRPRCVAIVPLLRADTLAGVLEAAFTRPIAPHERAFLDEAANAMAVALMTARSRARVQELLREVEEKARQLERVSAYKSEFLANMSHEIRTPLNGVVGMAELLLESGLTDVQREYAQTIIDSAEALTVIIDDILDFSKIEAGKLSLEVVPFDLEKAIAQVCTLLAYPAHSKGIELLFRYDPDAPRHVMGDPGRVRQIVTNLVGNGVKFTERGHVLVDVTCRGRTENEATIEVRVEDTGIGISEAAQKTLFQKFSQADTSTTRRFGGTGLGLAISKELVEMMGGTIGVKSQEGKGSTFFFTIRFPLAPASESTPPRSLSLEGLRVLIVDDHPVNRRILQELVSRWRMRSESVDQGRKALERLRAAKAERDPFQIILLDLCMPEMDGEAVLQAIRSDPALRETAVIVLASATQPGVRTRILEQGAAECMNKPIRASLLFDALVRYWERRTQPQASTPLPPSSSPSDTLPAPRVQTQRPLRVLVADDVETNRRVTEILLRQIGCEPVGVTNGEEVVQRVLAESFDLVLMDCQMPVMDGFEATQRIREAEASTGRHTKIIALTADAMADDRNRCFAAGMDDYLAKPLRKRGLLEMVDRHFPRQCMAHPSKGEAISPVTFSRSSPSPSPSPPSNNDPVFDRSHLVAMVGEAAVSDLLDKMRHDMEREIRRLEEAVTHSDRMTLTQALHAIKGAAYTVGALRLAKIAAFWYTRAKGGEVLDGTDVLAAIRKERDALFANLSFSATSLTKESLS